MSNILVAFGFTLLFILVIAAYVTAFRRQRAATRRRWREGDDAVAAMHSAASPSIVVLHEAPTHGVDSSFTGGSGEFGGAGASESYDSGGGDSGDCGGDGGGDGGD